MPSNLFSFSAKAGDRQRLALGAGFLGPVAAESGLIPAIADLGDHALKADAAGMLEHLRAVDLEAFAELNVRIRNELLEMGLALDQRQFSQITAVEIEQVEGHQYDLGGTPLQFILQYGEISGAVRGWHDDLAIDDRRASIHMQASAAIFRKRLVQSLPRRVKTLTAASLRWTWTR